MSTCRDVSLVYFLIVDGLRAASIDPRHGIQRVKKYLSSVQSSGFEDVLGRNGEAPAEGASFLLTAAQGCGIGSQAERIAMESLGRIRLDRSPPMKLRERLEPRLEAMARALGPFRKAVEETDNDLTRASAQDRDHPRFRRVARQRCSRKV